RDRQVIGGRRDLAHRVAHARRLLGIHLLTAATAVAAASATAESPAEAAASATEPAASASTLTAAVTVPASVVVAVAAIGRLIAQILVQRPRALNGRLVRLRAALDRQPRADERRDGDDEPQRRHTAKCVDHDPIIGTAANRRG